MPIAAQKITPCLWFDTEAEQAARFYCSIFKDSRIGSISHFNREGKDIHGKDAGSVMAVEFELEGQKFSALNGGPHFRFNEALSFQVHCDDQTEVDYFWTKLCDGGQEGPCGWLKDRYGLSWQIVPKALFKLLLDADREKSERVTKAFLQMKKFDISALERAYASQD
jgi:predicted 3-demethylubiquinone-9 3-methyltransferase (glyoxalase superfamily)